MLRPTPWRMLLEFHLIDFAVMSAEHDVSAKSLSRKVPTKRHAVAYKLSRWDASDSHLISLTLLHVHSSRRALAHSINLHFPSLPPYYNILVFLFYWHSVFTLCYNRKFYTRSFKKVSMPPFIGCSAYDNLRSPAFFALMNIFPYFFLLYHLFLLILQLQRVVGSEDVSSPTCVLGAQYGGIALCSLLFIILKWCLQTTFWYLF